MGELLLEMTSLLMQADKLALQEAQQKARAASRIAASVLRFARSALHGDAQHFSKVGQCYQPSFSLKMKIGLSFKTIVFH